MEAEESNSHRQPFSYDSSYATYSIFACYSEEASTYGEEEYDDLEVFGLSLMYASYGDIKGKGALKLRQHKGRVIRELERRANENNSIALCCLGEIGKNQDYLVKAAELGNGRAQIQLMNTRLKAALKLTNCGNAYFYDEVSLEWMVNSSIPGFNTLNSQYWASLIQIPTVIQKVQKKVGWR